MQNTKIIFYCTHHQYGNFEKIIFETTISNKIDNLHEAKEWLSDKIIESIYNDFDLYIVFDWIIIHYEKTINECNAIHEIKRINGRLTFPINKSKKTKSKYLLSEEEYNTKCTKLEKKKIDGSTESNDSVKKTYRSCWIDTSGKIHFVGFAMHNEYASNWLEKHDSIQYEKILESWGRYHYEELESRGWIKILGWIDPPCFVLPNRLTPNQKQSLRDYCIAQNVKYDVWPEILKS